MNSSILSAQNLQKSFRVGRKQPPIPVLRGISLDVAAGEMVSIVGPSGSGKSTLLYCLSGLEPYDAGSVALLGHEVGGLSRGALAALRRDHVGFVFQSYNLIPSLTARENVALPARLARRRSAKRDVAIARVLAMHPDVVFADEPTGSLDTATGSAVLGMLRDAASGPRSVVLVTHDLEAAARADRVLVLRDGLIHAELCTPTPEQVFDAVSLAGAPA